MNGVSVADLVGTDMDDDKIKIAVGLLENDFIKNNDGRGSIGMCKVRSGPLLEVIHYLEKEFGLKSVDSDKEI